LLRKIVYGDQSLRVEREYKITTFVRTIKGLFGKDQKEKTEKSHTFQSTGLRRDYRTLKKMAGRWTIAEIKKAFAEES